MYFVTVDDLAAIGKQFTHGANNQAHPPSALEHAAAKPKHIWRSRTIINPHNAQRQRYQSAKFYHTGRTFSRLPPRTFWGFVRFAICHAAWRVRYHSCSTIRQLGPVGTRAI